MEFSFSDSSHHQLISDILEIISDAVLVVDSENRIVFAGRKKEGVFRTPADVLKKKTVEHLFVADDREIMVPNILKYTRIMNECEGEAMLQRFGGTRFLGLLSTSFLSWKKESAMIVTIPDVSRMNDHFFQPEKATSVSAFPLPPAS